MTAAQTTDPRTASEADFAALLERHRRELHVHCYRMLGSFEDAEDTTQETFLRAWRKRESFEGRSSLRSWLYSIATNASLDQLKRRPRKPAGGEVLWLQPYPDELLDTVASDEDEPDAVVVDKETIELAFLVAIQYLPPRQRAALIVRDVLGWSARETADLLDTTVASANSALQRARATMKEHLPERRLEWRPGDDPSEREKALVARYVQATEVVDTDAFRDMLREDAVFSMPPEPGRWEGRDNIINSWIQGGFGTETLRPPSLRADAGQPPTGDRQLRAQARFEGVHAARRRRARDRGWPGGRHHHVPRPRAGGVRPAGDA